MERAIKHSTKCNFKIFDYVENDIHGHKAGKRKAIVLKSMCCLECAVIIHNCLKLILTDLLLTYDQMKHIVSIGYLIFFMKTYFSA